MSNFQLFLDMKKNKEKITMLTCYDYSFASLLDNCGIDIILVGDSLGMTMCGYNSTVNVSIKQVCYHTKNVSRGIKNSYIIADLPFASYTSLEQTYKYACKLIKAGANMVKVEGGAFLAETINFLYERGIPVCSHLGLMPQYINKLGGYKVQGKEKHLANQIINDALVLEEANASMIVLECIPTSLAKDITNKLTIPTIGIGAGIDCDGQVLVLQDMLGIFPRKKAKFVKVYMNKENQTNTIEDAIKKYIYEVKNNIFPSSEFCFS